MTHYDPRKELEAARYFLSQKVECLFNANPSSLEEVEALCRRAGVGQVVLDAHACGHLAVATDNRSAARELTLSLLRAARRAGGAGRLHFLGGVPEHSVTRERLAGFKDALRLSGLGFAGEQFVPAPFSAELVQPRLAALLGRGDVSGIFLNSLHAFEGLARCFAESPERCRAVLYAVFDHEPAMDLLGELRCVIARQDADGIMRKAYALFGEKRAGARARTHFVPHRLLATSSMRALLEG